MTAGSAGKRISEEEGVMPLIPSSTMLPCVVRLKLCERHRQTVPSDDDVQNVVAMKVAAWTVVVVHVELLRSTSSDGAVCA